MQTHCVYDNALFDIDFEHLLLTSCNQDLARSFGGEVHALEVYKVRAPVCHISARAASSSLRHRVQRTPDAIVSSHVDASSARFV
jgi:hypothetical protein